MFCWSDEYRARASLTSAAFKSLEAGNRPSALRVMPRSVASSSISAEFSMKRPDEFLETFIIFSINVTESILHGSSSEKLVE